MLPCPTRSILQAVEHYIHTFHSPDYETFKALKEVFIASVGSSLAYRSYTSWVSWVVACADYGTFGTTTLTGPPKLLDVARQMELHLPGRRVYVDTMRKKGTIRDWAEGRSGAPVQQEMARAWNRFQQHGRWGVIAKHFEAISERS